jgi:peptidoglycan/LPS O-acetylase OafA/YrhL
MTTAGSLTYPLYLIHQFIGYILLAKLGGYMPPLAALLLVMTIALLGAYLIATQIERRFAPLLGEAVTALLGVFGAREPARKTAKAHESSRPSQESARATMAAAPLQLQTESTGEAQAG